jgi:hypothetical protein
MQHGADLQRLEVVGEILAGVLLSIFPKILSVLSVREIVGTSGYS